MQRPVATPSPTARSAQVAVLLESSVSARWTMASGSFRNRVFWLRSSTRSWIGLLIWVQVSSPKGLEKARSWFKALLKYFRRRQLETPRQQKNYVRNAIRSRFGEDHPALKVVGFDNGPPSFDEKISAS